jgi:hypothetical protein
MHVLLTLFSHFVILVSCEHVDVSANEELASDLNLLQFAHGIVQAEVGAHGDVLPLGDVEDNDISLKPSSLAFKESEDEDDLNNIHLLQTSFEGALSTKGEQVDEISLGKVQNLPALEIEPGTIVSGPGDSHTGAVGLTSVAAQEASSDMALDASNALADTAAGSPAGAVRPETPVVAPPVANFEKLSVGSNVVPESIVSVPESVEAPKVASAARKAPKISLFSKASKLHHKRRLSHKGNVHRKRVSIMQGPSNASFASPIDLAVALSSPRETSLQDVLHALLAVGFSGVALLLIMLGASRLGKWCLSMYRYSEEKSIRGYIEGMRRSPGLEVVNQLIAGSVYDCAIMRPLASKQLIRLEARVEEAASGFCLWTPLSQQACVRFSCTVSQQAKDGSSSTPLSYQCSSIDFVISLLDAPHVRIEIEGGDLSTFDMITGRMSAKRTFDSAAKHWQDFAENHQIGGKMQSPSRFRSETSALEFQETAIVLGTSITVIGELQRNAVGTLLLRPSLDNASEDADESKPEPWRTSWESTGIAVPRSLQLARTPWLGKVWVSDDPSLLGPKHKQSQSDSDFGGKSSRDCSLHLADGLNRVMQLSLTPGGQ